MNNVSKASSKTEPKDEAYVTFFPTRGRLSSYDIGVAHEHNMLHRGRVLGGTRFGGMFEVIGSPLSTAETRVLALRALGVTTDQLRNTLGVSEGTLRTQDKHLLRKLGVNSMAKAVATAFAGETPFFIPYLYGQVNSRVTNGQKSVIRDMAQGLGLEEVADSLGRSPATVRSHVKNAYNALGVTGDNHVSLVTLAHLTDTVFMHSQVKIELPPLDDSRDIA